MSMSSSPRTSRKPLLLIPLVLLALVGLRPEAQAQTALVPCYGAPADYIARYDSVDGAVDGQVSYPEARVFLETQGWLQPPGETAIHHFEHIHEGLCYPYAETWLQPSNARTFDVRYIFHNVQNYNISAVSATFVDANNSGGGYTATAAQKAELEAAMDSSAGTTNTVFQSYTSLNIGTSCRKTFRPTLNTVRANPDALVDEWFAAGQWTSYIDYPGQPVCTPEFNQDQVRSRNWILPNGGYLYNTLTGLPTASQMSNAVNELTFTVNGTGQPYFYYIDPDFHAHPDNPGLVGEVSLGVVNGNLPVTVDLTGIPSGEHKLVVRSVRGITSSVLVIPFKKKAVCT